MSNDGSTPKKKLEAGFTSIDNRLMAKQDITIEQKVLLSQVVSMMNSTGRYNASNAYITAITGFNKKTIGKAFKLFNERGWLYHKVIRGGGRWVYFNKEHAASLSTYIGTVEEHKRYLESLKKNFDSYDIPSLTPTGVEHDQVKEEPTLKPEEIKIDSTPQEVIASEKITPLEKLTSKEVSVADEIPIDLVTTGKHQDLTTERNDDTDTKFGEPGTIEYFYYGKWWTINKYIDQELEFLKPHIDGITVNTIKRACNGDNVDTGEFQFTYKQKISA